MTPGDDPICPYCGLEYSRGVGCKRTEFDGMPRIPFGSEGYGDDTSVHSQCGDCGCPQNEFHHADCDVERCPLCAGQLLSCNCGAGLVLAAEPYGTTIIYCDGIAEPNPGPSACAAVCGDEVMKERLGEGTNNQAEYSAVFYALRLADKMGAKDIIIRSDSQLVVKQLNGEWNVNDPVLAEAHKHLQGFIQADGLRCRIEWIPRAQNGAADCAAAEALAGL